MKCIVLLFYSALYSTYSTRRRLIFAYSHWFMFTWFLNYYWTRFDQTQLMYCGRLMYASNLWAKRSKSQGHGGVKYVEMMNEW